MANSKVSATGKHWGDVMTVLAALANRGLSVPLLAKATTTTKIKTTNTFEFCCAGVLVSKGATDNIANTNLASTAAGESYYARLEISAGGTFSWAKGKTITGTAQIADMPPRTAALVTVGYVFFPASWTLDSSDFDAVGVVIKDGDPDLHADNLEA